MASQAALELIVSLKGDKQAVTGMKNMARESGGLGKAMGTLAKVGMGAVIGGVGLIAGGMAKALGEASEWQGGMAQLNAVLKSTGGAAGLTAEEVATLSQKLSASNGLSKFTDDAVLAGNNLLLTFTNIGKDVFPLASQAAVDMAQALGGEPVDQAVALGKALNDPVKGITALRRVGVAFTADQEKVIKSMVATGDVAGAQKLILAELSKEFGGSAAAAAGTFEGKMITLKEKLNDVLGAIGEKLLPVVTGFVDFLSKPETIAGIQSFAEGLMTGIGEAAKIVGPILGTIAENVGKFFTAMSSGDPQAIKAFWTDIGGPIGAIGGFLTTAATEVGKFIGAVASGDGENVKAFFNDLGGGPESILGKVGSLLVDATANVKDFIDGFSGEGSEGANQFWVDIKSGLIDFQTGWDNFWGPQHENVKVHSQEWTDMQADADPSKNGFTGNWETFWTNTKTNFDAYGQSWDTFWETTRTNLGISEEDWNHFWLNDSEKRTDRDGKVKSFWETEVINMADMKTNWDNFWETTRISFTSFGDGWDTYWEDQKTGVDGFGAKWTTFWTKTAEEWNAFVTNWDNFWGTHTEKAAVATTEQVSIGTAGVGSANVTKNTWTANLAALGIPVSTFNTALSGNGDTAVAAANRAKAAWEAALVAARAAAGAVLPGVPTGKAIGGPVKQGHPYIVGEKGPEMFVPRMPGTIVPNHMLPPERDTSFRDAFSRGGSSGGGNIGATVINLVVDGQVLARVLSPHLEERRISRNRGLVRGVV